MDGEGGAWKLYSRLVGASSGRSEGNGGDGEVGALNVGTDEGVEGEVGALNVGADGGKTEGEVGTLNVGTDGGKTEGDGGGNSLKIRGCGRFG